MSVEYDDKIVRMQFDNKGFESGIQTTLRSLESLKSSLNFNNAVVGIDEMTAGLKNLSLDNLTTGIERTIIKIPVMGTVMDQTIRNMTNSVEGFIKQTLDKFSTIGNAKAGFGEYELQIGAIKTIAASTGRPLEEINGYLEDLNKYADDTIYSFSDMTQNIGKFTNAGVELGDAVNAIKGVANVAAVSGANTQEASRAMYNFAQALSQGSVKLIDWKSIENANMATVEFKNELLKTALELGTIRKEGDKYISTTTDLTGHVSAAFDATSMFNESLSHQWLTTDVLVKTLNNYTDTTTEIGQKATEAATKVNTFHQAMDSIVEGLGSSWAQSWQYIVGDFEDATALWTKFKDAVEGLFKPANEARNEMLKFWSTGRKEGSETAEMTEETKKKYQDLFDVANKGMNGAFGNGETRIKALTEAGYDYAEVQSIINGLLDGSIKSWEDIAKTSEKANESIESGMTGREMFLKGISNLWETIHKLMGAVSDAWHDVFPRTTGQQLVDMSKAFMELTEKIKMSDKTVDELKRTWRGIFALFDIGLIIIKSILKGIGALVSGLMAGLSKSDIGIWTFTASIGDVIYKIDQLLKESKLFEVIFVGIGKVIGTVGGTILSIIVKVITALSDLFKSIFNLNDKKIDLSGVTDVFENASNDVGSFTEDITEKVASFSQIPVNGITTFTEKVANSFSLFGKVTVFFSKVAGVFSSAWDKVKKVFQVIGAVLSPVVDLVKDKLGDLMGGAYSFEDFIQFLKDGGGLILLGELITLIHTIKKTIGSGQGIGKALSEMFNSIGDSAKAMTQKIKAQALMQIALAIAVMVGAVYFLSKMDPVALATGLGALTILMLELNATLKKMSLVALAGTAGSLIAIGIAVLLLTASLKALSKMKGEDVFAGLMYLGILLKILSSSINDFKKVKGDLSRVSRVLVSLAAVVLLLMIPLQILGRTNTEVLWQGMLFLSLLIAELIGVIALLTVVGKIGGKMDKVSRVLISLAVTINLLLIPLLILAFLPIEKMQRGVTGLGVLLIALGAAVALMGLTKISDNVPKTLLLLSLIIGEMFYIIKELGSMDQSDLTQGEIALSLMVGLIAIVAYVLGKALEKVDYKAMLVAFGGIIAVIGVMVGVLYALSQLDPDKQAGAVLGLVAVVVLIVLLAIAIKLLASSFANPKTTAGAGVMAAAFLALGASVLMLGAGLMLVIAAIDYLNKMEISSDLLDKFAVVGAGILLVVENMIGGIIGAIIGAVPAIVDGALSVIDLILEGLDNNIESILEHITNIMHSIMDSLIKEGPGFAEQFLDFILGITGALANNAEEIEEIVGNVITIVSSVINGVANNISELNDSIENLIFNLIDDLSNRVAKIAVEIWKIVKRIWAIVCNFIKTKVIDPLANLGKNIAGTLVGGLIDGINNLAETIVDGVHDFLQALLEPINTVKGWLGQDPWEIPEFSVPDIPKPAKIEEWQNAAFAKGGTYNPNNVIVGEAGPELLSSRNGRSVVTPLSNSNARSTTKGIMDRYTSDITKQLSSIEGSLNQNRNAYENTKYDDSYVRKAIVSVIESVDSLSEEMSNLKVYLDGKALVGQLVGPMDEALGNRAVRRRK